MSRRTASTLGWAMWLLGVAAIVVGGLLSSRNAPISTTQPPESAIEGAIWVSGWVGFGLVGAMLVTSRPKNRIGWILCGITFCLGMALFLSAYARYALVTQPGALPFGSAVAWLATWAFQPLIFLVLALVVLFPGGSAKTRLGRWALRLLLLLAGLQMIAYAIRPGPIEGDTPPNNPLGIPGTKAFLDPAIETVATLFGAVALAALVDIILRYRRSRGVERQQFRWFVAAVAAFPLLFFAALALEELVLGYGAFDPVVVVFALWGNGTATAIGLAVARHGLYEIDRIISRTVSYSLIAVVLAAVYAGGVLGLQALIPNVGDLAIAASTLAAVALFSPLRRRVQSWVDRRFNRRRYDAEKVVEAFSSRLRNAVDLATVTGDLRSVVTHTVEPATASVWLRD